MAKGVGSTRRSSSRKGKRTLSSGQVHIYSTFNNTIVTITDHQGNTVTWGSSGSVGFKRNVECKLKVEGRLNGKISRTGM